MRRIPRKLIERYGMLPIGFRDGTLTIATSDPYDVEAIEEVQMAAGARVEIQVARRSDLLRAINELFYGGREETAVGPREETTATNRQARFRGMSDALIPLLIDKGIITEEELALKARELGMGRKPGQKPQA